MATDAHCHLHFPELSPFLPSIVADLASAGISGAIVNGTSPADWPAVAHLATRFPWVTPAFGLHPWDVHDRPADWFDTLRRRLDAAGPRAHIGEIGIDRWILGHPPPVRAPASPAPIDVQLEVARLQLALAAERDLPATIHVLRAWDDLPSLLDATPLPRRGFLLHAYSGPPDRITALAHRGAWFSFNPAFLSPRYARRLEAFRLVPDDRLLLETDAPAMPPPRNLRQWHLPPGPDNVDLHHPANLLISLDPLAALRGTTPARLARQIATNSARFIGPTP